MADDREERLGWASGTTRSSRRLEAYRRTSGLTVPPALWHRRTEPMADWPGLPRAVPYPR